MSHESNKALLNIETHTLPDDYPFSVDELDRIIAGEVVSPHQAAIMARELKKNDVRPKLLRQLRMITRRTCSGMRKNRFVTPTQIINASLAVWLRLGVIAAVIRELLQHRGFAKNNRPVVYIPH